MDLSVIIVNYNVYRDVLKCVKSVREKLHKINYEIIVIDNNSSERDINTITNLYHELRLIQLHSNIGFGAANNVGIEKSSGKYLLLLNPDITLTDFSINILLEYIESNSEVGVVAPAIKKQNGSIEHFEPFVFTVYSRTLHQFGWPYTHSKTLKRNFEYLDSGISNAEPFSVEWVIGACILVRRNIYEEVGGFDERYFLFEEETDWQYRIRQQGWDIKIIPKAVVIHNHHTSTKQLGIPFEMYHRYRSSIIFNTKHYKFITRNYLRFITLIALTLKYVYYWITSGFRISRSKTRSEYFIDLVKLTLSPKSKILNNKYAFKVY